MAPPKSPAHAALGAALRGLRHERGLTLEQLGSRAAGGMNPRYVSACERGEINISFANLLRLCDALDVTFTELATRYDALAGQTGD